MGDGPGPGVPRRLSGALLTASLMPLNSTMVAVAVPDIADELGHARTTVTQALVATYLITAIALQGLIGSEAGRITSWSRERRPLRFSPTVLPVTVSASWLSAGAISAIRAWTPPA